MLSLIAKTEFSTPISNWYLSNEKKTVLGMIRGLNLQPFHGK